MSIQPGGKIVRSLKIEQFFRQGFGSLQRQAANPPSLFDRETAKASLQQTQDQCNAFFLAALLTTFLTTFLATFLATFLTAFLTALLTALLVAFLTTFGEDFLIKDAFFQIGMRKSEHGLNLLSSQFG